MTDTHIAGAGMVRFGKFPAEVTFENLAAGAVRAAMTDAGAQRTDIQAVYVGHVFGGPVAGQRVAVQLGLGGLPVCNHENYCASGATRSARPGSRSAPDSTTPSWSSARRR